jgi:hypothetical protein
VTALAREDLRAFLRLGARAQRDGITVSEIERQEDTVIRALDMLNDRPGILLADEVGMGKTFEALGIVAAFKHRDPRSKIVIVTPGPDLNQKWFSEIGRFGEMFDFGGAACKAGTLTELIEGIRKHSIVVAPVTVFQSGRGTGDQTYLLSLYFHWKKLHGHTANAILARFKDGEHDRVDVADENFLGIFDLKRLEPHLSAAFRKGKETGVAGLDDLYKSGKLAAFANHYAVQQALYRARFVLSGRLLPMIDLLIVDEAHKLKNPGSLRTRAMRSVFDRRFRKALFLTATPFQLDVTELREIFSLFSTLRKTSAGASKRCSSR